MTPHREHDPERTLPEPLASTRRTARPRAEVAGTLGRYRIVRPLGSGAQGDLFEAVRDDIQRRVAIKVARSSSQDAAERLTREARILARLEHPGLAQVYELGHTPDGAPFLAMELIEGDSLQEELDEVGRFEPVDAVRAMVEALDILAVTHSEGVLHRDVKPANLIRARPDRHGHRRVRLVDFGIGVVDDDRRITGATELIGTPAYIAPERLTPHLGPDPRVDVYSAGVTLFVLLTGTLPYVGRGRELFEQVLFAPPPRVRDRVPSLPDGLDEVVARAMEKQRALRFSSAYSMREALERFL